MKPNYQPGDTVVLASRKTGEPLSPDELWTVTQTNPMRIKNNLEARTNPRIQDQPWDESLVRHLSRTETHSLLAELLR